MPEAPSEKDHNEQQAFLKRLCRHLVSVTATIVVPTGPTRHPEEHFVNYSGFVVSYCGVWLLLTAGHVLSDIRHDLRTRRYTFKRCELMDCYGLCATFEYGIPFNISEVKQAIVENDELGFDVGCIPLSPHYRGLLEKNGIEPVAQDQWHSHAELDFDFYGILGFPDELLDRERKITATGQTISGGMRAVLMAADKAEAVPRGKPDPVFPWLAIQLRDKQEISSIRGMSGGPIFGFKHGPDSKILYTIAAIQSCWDKERRIAFGTRLPAVFAYIEASIESDIAEGARRLASPDPKIV